MKLWRAPALAAALALSAGCSDIPGLAARYRAERMLQEARREETRLRLGRAQPDSATLLEIRRAYSRLRAAFPRPFVPGAGETARQLNAAIARQVGAAELTSAQLALVARRPDLAMEHARWVASVAEADTGMRREADFLIVATLTDQRKIDEAIQWMHAMLERYPPNAPSSPDREDRILKVPDEIIALREQTGDVAGAKAERLRALEYYRALLKAAPPPLLEAQLRAKVTHTLIELGSVAEAYAAVSALRKLVSSTPVLMPLESEILYSEARIRAMGSDPTAALDLYDLVVMMKPRSRFASKALLDSGILLERKGDLGGALARYRAAYDQSEPDPESAPVASYRAALVEDRLGNWAEAKQLLEGLPVRFPQSRATLEAPFAIAAHYTRTGQTDAMKAALGKAVNVFRALIARDSTAAICTSYRWSILRAYAGLGRWKEALAAVDEMAAKDRGTPLAAEALARGASIAKTLRDKSRSDKYLQLIIRYYPDTPYASAARQTLEGDPTRPRKYGGNR